MCEVLRCCMLFLRSTCLQTRGQLSARQMCCREKMHVQAVLKARAGHTHHNKINRGAFLVLVLLHVSTIHPHPRRYDGALSFPLEFLVHDKPHLREKTLNVRGGPRLASIHRGYASRVIEKHLLCSTRGFARLDREEMIEVGECPPTRCCEYDGRSRKVVTIKCYDRV
jgi:hypothetical protein